RRRLRLASLRVGRLSASRCQAKASADRSLSEKDSTTISAGDWPRSTATSASSSVASWVARTCISALNQRLDGGLVEALLADHDQPALARLARGPAAVILVLEAAADTLHQQAHRLAGDIDEALHAKDIVRLGRLGQTVDHSLRRLECRQVDDESVEVVVVVL